MAGLFLVVALAVASGWLAEPVQRLGHFWGDDFALYIRQALSLHDGTWQQVLEDNRFTLEHSGWSSFSPLLYPWGFPLLLAPLVGDGGFDYDSLKVVGTVSMAVFVIAFNRVITPRSGYWPALALSALFAVSLPYLRLTDTIQSDLPFAAVAMLTLWAIDAVRRRGRWQDQDWRSLVPLGLLLTAAFTTRREGLALVAGVAASQAIEIWGDRRSGRRRLSQWFSLALPHLVFVAAAGIMQLALPAAIAPTYPGTGPRNIPAQLLFYLREFAVHIGVIPPGAMDVFGSAVAGWIVVILLMVALVVGVGQRLRHHLSEDAAIVGFVTVSFAALLQLPFHDGRYALSLTPFLAWWTMEGAITALGRRNRAQLTDDRRRYRARIGVAALVGMAAMAGGIRVAGVATSVEARNAAGVRVWGPTDPAALELWEAVETHTDPHDVVAFFRSRLMTLETGRRSLQSGQMDPILDHADWFAWEKASEYSQPDPPEVRAAGLDTVWENRRFALLRVERSGG